jgi:hypothetical protein
MPVQNEGTTILYDSGCYLRYIKPTSIMTNTKSRHTVTNITDQVLSSVVRQTAMVLWPQMGITYQPLKI